MKRTMIILAALAAAGIAHAQTSTTMDRDSVKSKLEASGYSNVTNIKQGTAGQWSADATKDGKQIAVTVDSTGTVKEAQQ